MSSFGWDFPSVGELTELHSVAITAFGGAASPPKEGCVDRSIASAINASLYSADDDGEPDLLLAAAHLLFYVAKNHCFADGNKRAAWSAVIRALDLNGIRVEADPDEAAELVEGVASGARTVRDILLWFYEPGRIRARPDPKE
ncbi:MAG TPA: type II toxin-antitoxin system death-on-curing family toxin [Polyangiaceae bacterium]|jgi:death-on-curing protein|nr:type II toxin-antitoxin system death-on-curing family toxin [Polyangiaceae bacterium]